MSRRKNILATSPTWDQPRASVTGAEPDHLKGQHFEDFMSKDSTYNFRPDTPMQAMFQGPVEDDRTRAYRKAEWMTPEERRKAAWKETTDPGGHTFIRGDFLDD